MLVDMLTYTIPVRGKARLAGIRVVLQEESYTSMCSFLDGEYPEKREQYAGRRISRGLFRAGDGTLVNADVNGSYNIIRKAFPKAFEGIEGVFVVHPVRVEPS
jgi:putative transposase